MNKGQQAVGDVPDVVDLEAFAKEGRRPPCGRPTVSASTGSGTLLTYPA